MPDDQGANAGTANLNGFYNCFHWRVSRFMTSCFCCTNLSNVPPYVIEIDDIPLFILGTHLRRTEYDSTRLLKDGYISTIEGNKINISV